VLIALLLAVMQLPPGVTVVRKEMTIPAGTRVVGHAKGSVLRAASTFRGRAILVCARGVIVENLTIDGNRARLARPVGIAPYDRDFIGYYDRNGLIADGADGLTVRNVVFRNSANFAAIVARSKDVTFERVTVQDSGSLDAKGRNNTTGGILLEEGTSAFAVRSSRFLRVRGNGVWTHSRYESPRNGPGVMEGNHFEEIGRDALQAGHATGIRIERNTGRRIGYPVAVVDAIPVAIDTAGNVDKSVYADNRFQDINGKCIDLDGFHHGDVRRNVCIDSANYAIVFNNTNPDMQSSGIRIEANVIDGTKYGGIFVIGHGNTITRNKLTRVNTARCNDTPGCVYDTNQPDLLRSGIYVGSRAERPAPARDNVVTDNTISGYGMDRYCVVAAPDVRMQDQNVARNDCTNTR
jgi:hypothetical protein